MLDLAAEEFDVFVTLDSNLAFQQNTRRVAMGIVAMHVTSSRYESLHPLIPSLIEAIKHVGQGALVDID